MNKPDQNVIGAFEKVSFPEFGIKEVTAKIDTGAYTGAIHATNIVEEKQADKMVLHFSPVNHPSTVYTTEDYFIKPVTSSNGHLEQRYFVDTEIVVNDTKYPILISLTDRSAMTWPVLIGRRFIRANKLLVDVTRINK
jgi:hypothetical protein